ncbi:hypothetical protein ACIOZL_19495 [Streptomyces sp. NPDC087769]|uniref:hypothetical protein n=1 Tax=Streptomyces sp. NPDC087769 TaxID=3365802 RepID=UPI00380DC058
MTATPDHPAEPQAQHIADLREALQESARWLAFAAGREAATDPTYAEWLLEVAEKARAVLAITADPHPSGCAHDSRGNRRANRSHPRCY